MNKMKKEELPQKRALKVDEIISKYPESVRILLVELVQKIENLQKKSEVTEEWIEQKARFFRVGFCSLLPATKLSFSTEHRLYIEDFIRSLVEEIPVKKPIVTEEFADKWTKIIWFVRDKSQFELIKDMLKEAGVKVVGK